MKSITLSGQVSNPQLRYTPENQTPVLEFTLQFENPKTSDSDEIKVLAWKDYAEYLSEVVQEGDAVVVQGRLKTTVREVLSHKAKEVAITASQVHLSDAVGLNLNNVHLIGRLGQEPDIQYFESGRCLCKFSLAVRRNGTEANWFDIELWGKTAEVAADYTRKGGQVGIEGQIAIDHWKDRNTGGDRSKTVIKGNDITLISSASPSNEALDEF